MAKRTWSCWLTTRWSPVCGRLYLGTVYERTKEEAIAAAEACLTSHDEDECTLEVEPI